MMEILPSELYVNIFRFFTANTMKSALLVNKEFKSICFTKYIWYNVYKNTIPSKFITYEKDDFRTMLKYHLSLLHHTEWFKRQMFLDFVYNKLYLDSQSSITQEQLIKAFQKYSNNQFNQIPRTWYWDSLDGKHEHKAQKLLLMASTTKYVNSENDKYIHWNFPYNEDGVILGFGLVKE